MKKIKVEQLTKEAFAEFGEVLSYEGRLWSKRLSYMVSTGCSQRHSYIHQFDGSVP